MNIESRINRFVVEPKNLLLYIAFAICITLFMGYIDEGFYSFEFLKEPGVIFILSLYGFFFLVINLLLDAFTFRKVDGMKKGLLTLFVFLLAVFTPFLIYCAVNTF